MNLCSLLQTGLHQESSGPYFFQMHLFQSHKPCCCFNVSAFVTLIFMSVVIVLWASFCSITVCFFFFFHVCNPLFFSECCVNVSCSAITTYSQMGAGHALDPSAVLLSVGCFLGVLAGSFLLGFIFTVITALISFHPLPSLPPRPKTQLSPQHPLQSIHFLNLVIASLTNPYCTTSINKSNVAKTKVLQRH